MKFHIFSALLIIVTYKKIEALLDSNAHISIWIKIRIRSIWITKFSGKIGNKPFTEKLKHVGMKRWKNGYHSHRQHLNKKLKVEKMSLSYDDSRRSFTFEKVRLVHPDGNIHIWRCKKLCKSNTWYKIFESYCPRGKFRVRIVHKCKPCEPGYWGIMCKNRCNKHCLGNRCNTTWGGCDCEHRYYGYGSKNTCPGSYYLNKKTRKCTENCHCYDNNQCDVLTGKCHDNKCEINYYGPPLCNKYCLYGRNCKYSCHCNQNAKCNQKNGFCPTGCSMRYVGYDCSIYCRPGFHGLLCNKPCTCALPDQCNATSGRCVKGGCDHHHYGKHCENKCVQGSKQPECSKRCFCKSFVPCGPSKTCGQGCHNRYYGTSCDLTCPPYKYIVNGSCTGKCACNSSVTCRVSDGTCDKPRCPIGRYGKDCALKCHCLDPKQCDMDTGYCFDKKCESAQYYGSDCQISCDGDFYLVNGQCTGICHCLNNSNCNVINGRCVDSSCAPGYIGSRCHIECKDGYYGHNCSYTCHCKFNDPCDRRNGFCEHGCMYGYTGTGCQTEAGYYEIAIHALVWSSVLIVLLLFAFTMNFFMFQDRKKREEKTISLIQNLKNIGYDVMGVRKKTLALDKAGQRKSLTLIDVRTSQSSLTHIAQSRLSHKHSNQYNNEDYLVSKNKTINGSKISSLNKISSVDPKEAHNNTRIKKSAKDRELSGKKAMMNAYSTEPYLYNPSLAGKRESYEPTEYYTDFNVPRSSVHRNEPSPKQSTKKPFSYETYSTEPFSFNPYLEEKQEEYEPTLYYSDHNVLRSSVDVNSDFTKNDVQFREKSKRMK